MKENYTVSFTKNDVAQARLVKAENAEQALAYFAEIEPTATVHGASLDQCNLERRGCPVEIVPDGWQPATSKQLPEQEQTEPQDTTAAKLDEALTAKHEEAKHFNDAMSERFDPISEIIILHAISNAAEEVYDNHPEDKHAEQMFDEAYKDEWNAVEAFAGALMAEFKCSSNAARAAIWRYVDAHPVAFRDEHGTLEMELYSHAQEAANRIAQHYYTADTNAVYICQNVEYTLSADSFKDPLLVHFVGFGKNKNLFVPVCHLGSFLPGVASEGMQIVKGV